MTVFFFFSLFVFFLFSFCSLPRGEVLSLYTCMRGCCLRKHRRRQSIEKQNWKDGAVWLSEKTDRGSSSVWKRSCDRERVLRQRSEYILDLDPTILLQWTFFSFLFRKLVTVSSLSSSFSPNDSTGSCFTSSGVLCRSLNYDTDSTVCKK